MNVVCFGDSITYASGAEVDRWPTILQMKLEAFKPGEFKVYNKGIGGNTTSQGLDRFINDIEPLLPGIVLMEFGFNDCSAVMGKPRVGIGEFELNLREFHRAITAKGGTPVFIVNHPITQERADVKVNNGRTYGDNFYEYNPVVKKVAQDLNAQFIDIPAVIEAKGIDIAEFTGADGLHLSVAGNHEYGTTVFDALKTIIG